MEEEIWKTIPISMKYEASTYGRIRKKDTEYIIKSHETPRGYQQVGIKGTNGESITRLVHRLVAITFIDNPDNKPTVNHIEPCNGHRSCNGHDKSCYGHGRSCNNLSNLEWATYQEQASHSRKRKLTIEEQPSRSKWGNRRIWKCDEKTGDRIEMFSTIREAACSVPPIKSCLSLINTVAEGHEISQSIPNSRECITTAAGYKWVFDNLRVFQREEWREINKVDANNQIGYEISTIGRLCTPTGEVRSTYGPVYSNHSILGKELSAHRLVALTFLPCIEGKDIVNHIDGNINNPCLDNLEWNTYKENSKHAYENGLLKPNVKKVWQYSLEGEYIQEFESISSANRKYGAIDIHRSLRRSSPAGGFIWKYPSNDKDRVVKLRKPSYNGRKIKQYTLDGVFIKEYESLRDAKIAVPGVINNAPHSGGSSAGFRWKYSSDTSPFTKKTYTRKINQYDLQMNLIETHKSIAAACIKVPGVCIYWSLKKSRPSKGFYWKYA